MIPLILTTLFVPLSGVAKPVPNFRHDVQAVLTRAACNSGACHGALAGKGGFKLSLRGYDPDADFYAITRQASARRVNGQSPAESLLLQKATRELAHGGGTRFYDDSVSYAVLLDWIKAGAPGPSANDPKLTQLRVSPPSANGQAGDKATLKITATYSDGRVADVTRWAKFTTSAEPTASVSEDGEITITGPGEAGVAALFGSKVAIARVSAPFPNRVTAADYDKFVPVNFIDRLALAQWKKLQLPPSPTCTDAEFLRRTSLDATGMLPTTQLMAEFRADTRPDKRAKLVDRLLVSPGYVDFWTHKWSDLLLVSSRKLSDTAMWAFYQDIRSAVAANEPWDRFAWELLTATGPTDRRGAGNFFVLHKDTAELAETTAVTFLGMSVGCCKCHNHPLEKWTQDQYWGQANLFSRVGIKSVGADSIVYDKTVGNALHPRTGQPVAPTPLDGVPIADDGTDRREYYADWLIARDNPYFRKALVNRVWKNFMGRGLVEAEDDLRETNPPTNPALLAALADEFLRSGHDVKALCRAIMTSATYQRSSTPLAGNLADDQFYSRHLVSRLSAEVILDAYSDVTGVPTGFDQVETSGRRFAKKAFYPAGTRAIQLPDAQLVSQFLDAFGRAPRAQVCACERSFDASVGQALHLNNGVTLNDKLRAPRSIVSRWLADKTAGTKVVDELFSVALSREPSASERTRFIAAIDAASESNKREVLEDVVWAVLTGKEFLFNH